MAVICSNCGRQYDQTLFQFGRIIDCHCGLRVGFEHRINLPQNSQLRFFADVNVGRLARWLRALGIDTIWEDRIADGELVRRALEEKRYILTLDKLLPEQWRVGNVLLLKSEPPLEQLREVVRHFKIKRPSEFFTRCLVCNSELRKATPEEVVAQVPTTVRENQTVFQRCPNCRKTYWEGSHTTRMQTQLENIFERQPD